MLKVCFEAVWFHKPKQCCDSQAHAVHLPAETLSFKSASACSTEESVAAQNSHLKAPFSSAAAEAPSSLLRQSPVRKPLHLQD